MRKLYILAVFCYAVYSCTINLDDKDRGVIRDNKSYTLSQKNTTLKRLQNEDVNAINKKITEEQNEQTTKEISKGDISTEQMLGDSVGAKENGLSPETEKSVAPNALLDIKIVATMTVEKLEKMLSNGADVNAKDKNGTTVLMLYSSLSSIDIIRALLDNGADINAVNSRGGTALIAACQKNQREVIDLLLQRGANPHAQTSSGKTALDFMSNNKNLSTEDKIGLYDIVIQQYSR